jgi:hypothetical protein
MSFGCFSGDIDCPSFGLLYIASEVSSLELDEHHPMQVPKDLHIHSTSLGPTKATACSRVPLDLSCPKQRVQLRSVLRRTHSCLRSTLELLHPTLDGNMGMRLPTYACLLMLANALRGPC